MVAALLESERGGGETEGEEEEGEGDAVGAAMACKRDVPFVAAVVVVG